MTVQYRNAQHRDALQLRAQISELAIAVSHHRLLGAQSALRGFKLGLARADLRLHDSELPLGGRNSLSEIFQALLADQISHVGQQDQHEHDERHGRHDVSKRGPNLACAIAVR